MVGRSHFRNRDGANYLPPGRIYKNMGFIGTELITETLKYFNVVIKNPDVVAHSYSNFRLLLGGSRSAGMPSDSAGFDLVIPPGMLSNQVEAPINTWPKVMGLGNGLIYLPPPGNYQPQLTGKIDGIDFGPVDIGPIITVTPVPSLKLLGNDVQVVAGTMPPGNFTQGTQMYFTLSKFIAEIDGEISQWQLYLPGNSNNYGGSYALAIYVDNGGPYGSPMGKWSSFGMGSAPKWAPISLSTTFPVIADEVYWIGVVAAYGPGFPAQCYSSAVGGECYHKLLSEPWYTLGFPIMQTATGPDSNLAGYAHDAKLIMVAGYGN